MRQLSILAALASCLAAACTEPDTDASEHRKARSHLPCLRRMAGLAVLGLAGCGDAPPASNSVTPISPSARLEIVAGSDAQIGAVGAELPRTIQVVVRRGDHPVPDARVAWQVASGGIRIRSPVTDRLGVASAIWTLGGDTGTQRVVARLADSDAPPVTIHATAVDGRRRPAGPSDTILP